METKTPRIIDLFLLALIGLGIWGVGFSSVLFSEWRMNSNGPSFFSVVALGTVFGTICIYAVDGILTRRSYGLYLGLVPLLVTFGFALRLLSTLFAHTPSADMYWLQIYARMTTLGFVIALATFILKLGFSKTVSNYFVAKAIDH